MLAKCYHLQVMGYLSSACRSDLCAADVQTLTVVCEKMAQHASQHLDIHCWNSFVCFVIISITFWDL